MSLDTSGSVEYSTMPPRTPSAARWKASLTRAGSDGRPDEHDEVGDRAIGDGNPECHPVQPRLHGGDDLGGGPSGPGGGGHDVECGSQGPTGIIVQPVYQELVAGVGVRGRHEPILDTERVIEDFDHRGQAVRRTGGIGHHEVARRIESVIVDADHKGGIGAFARGGHHDTGCARVEVSGGLGRPP